MTAASPPPETDAGPPAGPPDDLFDVDVRGGKLRAGRWGSAGPLTIGIHGVTANLQSWQAVGPRLGRNLTFVAPDLRGRGRSSSLPGPWSMQVHADDMVAIIDHMGADDATLIGHSMGAWVALATAERHPGRVHSIVLVDGGLPLTVPENMSVDEILSAVLGPAIQRLSMSFESEAAYLDYWRAHPAVGEMWSPLVERYLLHDLDPDARPFRSSVSLDAVRGDGESQLTRDYPLDPDCPITMLRAPRGLMNEPGGLYPDAVLEPIVAATGLEVTTVDDVNHYSIVFQPWGAAAVAAAVHAVRSRA